MKNFNPEEKDSLILKLNDIKVEEIIPHSPDIYRYGNFTVFDFETTNLDKGDFRNKDNRIITSSFSKWEGWEKVDEGVNKGEDQYGLLDCIYNSDFVVAHNTKFELGWLLRLGEDISKIPTFCTQIAQYVINGNRRSSLRLDDIAKKRGYGGKESFVSKQIKYGICPSQIPYNWLSKYCTKDVDLTAKIMKDEYKELKELGLLNVFWSRCLVTPVLVDISRNGMVLDRRKVVEVNQRYEQILSEKERQLRGIAGEVNFNSTKQMAVLLYERLGFSELTDRRGNPIRTDKDGRKTDHTTITKLQARGKRQREFIRRYLEWNSVNTALTKNLRYFRAIVEETEDGIVYANFNQTVTKTHRLSSTSYKKRFKLFDGKEKGIQFQNIPREFKELFKARREGWYVGERDEAQLEFRTAVYMGKDTQGYEDISQRVDVHNFTAKVLTDAGEFTERQEAKSRTFKPLYGGQSGTNAEREYYKAFRKKYAGIAATQEEWKEIVERTKELRIPSGLIFYWPDTKWEGGSRNPYLRNTTSICNFPVQSFATADIVPAGLVINYYLIKMFKLQSFIINTIHDSVEEETHPEEVELSKRIGELSFTKLVKEYLKWVYGIDFDIELEVETKYGPYWGENILGE